MKVNDLFFEIYLLSINVGQHTEVPTYDFQDFTSWINDTFLSGFAFISSADKETNSQTPLFFKSASGTPWNNKWSFKLQKMSLKCSLSEFFKASGNEPLSLSLHFFCSNFSTSHTLDTYLHIPFFNILVLFEIARIYFSSGVCSAITTEWGGER